jgi:hypothetical protein
MARSICHIFKRRAVRLGFPALRFHDLHGSHETALLDAGVPIHVGRCTVRGVIRRFCCATMPSASRKTDDTAAAAISALSQNVLGTDR